jgi:Inhibitor of vertebrate lysozyme (Ivy)
MNKNISKTIKKLIVIYLLSNSTFASAAEEYLFELLEQPKYLNTWNTLIASQKNVDAWLAVYSKTKDGPAGKGTVVHLNGQSYQINFVCKAHDCGDNRFIVMFSADANNAWGLLLTNQKETFFGSPDDEKMNFLRAEFR